MKTCYCSHRALQLAAAELARHYALRSSRFLALALCWLLAVGTLPGRAQGKDANNTQVADFAQYANVKAEWTFGALNQQHSSYYERTSTLQRVTLTGLPTDSQQHTSKFEVLAVKGGVHAYDFLTSYEQAIADYQAVPGQLIATTSVFGGAGP